MTYITLQCFDSNPSLSCEINSDLLHLFNKNFTLPNQAFWTLFGPSRAVSMKVISVLRMKYFEMGKWLQLKKAEKHVGKLVFLHQTFGSGSLATGFHIPAESLVPHRFCSLRTLGTLCLRQISLNWHSLCGALDRWKDGHFGLSRQPHQGTRRKSFSAKAGTNDVSMEEGVSAH